MNAVLVFLAVSSGLPVDAESNVNWMTDYREAYNIAKAKDRQLLVILENPSDPEDQFRPVSFSKQALEDKSLEPYELCRVDITTPYGEKVAKAFSATEFPYTAITDKGASKIVFRRSGKLSDEEWKTTLVNYKNAVLVSNNNQYRTNGYYYSNSYQPINTYYAPSNYYYQRSSSGCST